MKSKWMFAALLAVPMIASTAYGDEDKPDQPQQQADQGQTVKLGDLPSAVRSTVQDEAKGKRIDTITKSTENGKTIYKLSIVGDDGKSQDVKISDAGKVIERMPAHEQKSELDQTQPPSEPVAPPSEPSAPSEPSPSTPMQQPQQ